MDGLAALRTLPPGTKPEGQRRTSSALVRGYPHYTVDKYP